MKNAMQTDSDRRRTGIGLEWIACLAFISLGIPDAVLGVSWPSIAAEVQRPVHWLGWLVASGFSGYLLATLNATRWANRMGLGWLLVASSGTMCAILFCVANVQSWQMMLGLVFISGMAGGAIDVVINAFASIRFSARWLNWMHACWGIGAATGPLAMTAMIANQISWRTGYVVLAVMLLLMCIALLFTREQWRISRTSTESPVESVTALAALRNPRTLGICGLYWLYTGVESTAGYLLFSYLTLEREYSIATAGSTTSAYWGALTIGRIVFGQWLQLADKARTLRVAACGTVLAALLLAMGGAAKADLVGAVLLGFSLAPVFPTWIAITPQFVGQRYADTSIGLLMGSAAIGVATCPLLVGQLASRASFAVMPICLLVGATLLMFIQFVILSKVAAQSSESQSTALQHLE